MLNLFTDNPSMQALALLTLAFPCIRCSTTTWDCYQGSQWCRADGLVTGSWLSLSFFGFMQSKNHSCIVSGVHIVLIHMWKGSVLQTVSPVGAGAPGFCLEGVWWHKSSLTGITAFMDHNHNFNPWLTGSSGHGGGGTCSWSCGDGWCNLNLFWY